MAPQATILPSEELSQNGAPVTVVTLVDKSILGGEMLRQPLNATALSVRASRARTGEVNKVVKSILGGQVQ